MFRKRLLQHISHYGKKFVEETRKIGLIDKFILNT